MGAETDDRMEGVAEEIAEGGRQRFFSPPLEMPDWAGLPPPIAQTTSRGDSPTEHSVVHWTSETLKDASELLKIDS
jgi:hypothetical protein